MNSSAGLFVMAVGAIVALGIRDSSGRINFTVIGIIIMLAGAAGSWVSYTIATKRRQAAVIKASPDKPYRAGSDGPSLKNT